MKTAISYSRVSKEDDSQDYTRQQDDILAYCQANNYQLVQEFAEKKSGLKKNRAGLTAMLDYCKINKPSALIVSEISRLGRTNEVLNTIEQLKDLKVNFISLKDKIVLFNDDMSINPNSALLINILTGIAAFEVSSLDYRIKSKLRKNARENKSCGYNSMPLGYTTNENNEIIIDENEAIIIRKIFDMYKNGVGVYTITNFLNTNNILNKRGKEFTQFSIHFILKNPIYKGYRRFSNELYFNQDLAIIDAETFDYCQNLKKSKVNYEHINGKYQYLLNDVCFCGHCNNKFVGIQNYVKGKQHSKYYTCKLNRSTKNCENIGVGVEFFDEFITSQVLVYFSEEIFKNQDLTAINNEISLISDLIKSTQSLLNNQNKAQLKLLDLYIQDSINKSVLDVKLNEVEKEKASLEAELSSYNTKLAELKRLIELKSDRQAIAKEIRENGLKKELLNKIIDKIILTKIEKYITEKNKYCFDVEIKAGDFSVYFYVAQKKDVVIFRGTNKNMMPESLINKQIEANLNLQRKLHKKQTSIKSINRSKEEIKKYHFFGRPDNKNFQYELEEAGN